MNRIIFSCPVCRKDIIASSEDQDTEVDCPYCASTIAVADVASTPLPPEIQNVRLRIAEYRRELKGFHEYYTLKMQPYLVKLRERQKAARKQMWTRGPLGMAITVAVAWWLFGTYGLNFGTFMVVGTLGAVTPILAFENLGKIHNEARIFLLVKVCRFFGFSYNQVPPKELKVDFDESGLFPKHEKQEWEDHIHGEHNGVGFDMVECRLTVEKGSGDDRYDAEVYHGVLFRFALPRQFNGRTLVLRNRGRFGNLLKRSKPAGERVRLEDPAFETMFEVWASDQNKARCLLTSTFMERLVQLDRSVKADRLEFCFSKNLMLVSAHLRKEQFESGGMLTNVADYRHVEVLVNEICRVFDIVDTLQLCSNTRI